MTRNPNAIIYSTQVYKFTVFAVFTDFKMCYDNCISGPVTASGFTKLAVPEVNGYGFRYFVWEPQPVENSRLHLQSERGKDERIRQNTI